MAEITSGRSPDGRIVYLRAGSPDARPILFLHGIGGGARLFETQLGPLGDGFHALAWNMPGYGGSAPIAPGGIDGYARVLGAFVADLGLPPPLLVGHSIGGMIVQAYLADAMGPASGAVLAQTSAAFGGRDPRWAEDFVRARLQPLDGGASMATLADASVAGMIGDDPDPDGVALARAVLAETPAEAYRASTVAMIGFDRREALARMPVPVLLLAGTKDANAPAATVARMAAAIPGSRLVTLEGCGHLAMLERPAAFTAAIRDFASDLRPLRTAA